MKVHLACVLVVLLLLTACKSEAAIREEMDRNARFSVTITGDLTASFDQSQSQITFSSFNSEQPFTALDFSNTSSGIVQNLSLRIGGAEPASGTYHLVSASEIDTDSNGVHVVMLDNTSGEREFSDGTGTLTLEVKDGKGSGSFTFSLTGGEMGAGNDNSQSITVEGTFSDIRLRLNCEDGCL